MAMEEGCDAELDAAMAIREVRGSKTVRDTRSVSALFYG